MVASGVRSSWEALATNRRCAANALSSRASSPSMVSARSFSSSPGPGMASRSSRLSAEIRRVAAVITRSGRSTRPATTQPTTTDSAAITPSAISDPSRNWCEMAAWAWSAGDGAGWRLPSRATRAPRRWPTPRRW